MLRAGARKRLANIRGSSRSRNTHGRSFGFDSYAGEYLARCAVSGPAFAITYPHFVAGILAGWIIVALAVVVAGDGFWQWFLGRWWIWGGHHAREDPRMELIGES